MLEEKNYDRKAAVTALDSCDVDTFKWIIENNYVSVDDYLLIDIIKQWPNCAKQSAISPEFVYKNFTDNVEDSEAHMIRFMRNNSHMVKDLVEQLIYYQIWRVYTPNLKRQWLDTSVRMKRFRNLVNKIDGDAHLAFLLKKNNAFRLMEYCIEKNDAELTGLVCKYGYFRGEIYDFEDIWNRAWEAFTDNEHNIEILSELFQDDRFVATVSTILLWKMLIFGISYVSVRDKAREMLGVRLKRNREFEKVLHSILVELKVSHIEILCDVVDETHCSRMIKRMISWWLPRGHKLKKLLKNRQKFSINTLRATLISFYSYKLTTEGIWYEIRFGKPGTSNFIRDAPDFKLFAAPKHKLSTDGKAIYSKTRFIVLPTSAPSDELIYIVTKSNEVYGLLIVEEILDMGYKFMGLYEIDRNTYKKHIHNRSESIKQNFYV